MGVCGAIIGGNPLAYLVDLYSWRTVMLGSASIGAIIALGLWIIITEPTSTNSQAKLQPGYADLLLELLNIIKNKQIWVVSICASLMVIPIAAYSELWGVSFIQDKYGIQRPVAALVTTSTFIGIAIGGPIIGAIVNYIGYRKIPLIIGCIGATLCLSLIIECKIDSLHLLFLTHTLFGFFTSSMLLCFTINSELVPTKNRGTIIGLTNTIIMGGSAVTQPIIGRLLDLTAVNYRYSFLLIILSPLLSLFLATYIKETYVKSEIDNCYNKTL